MKTFVSDASYLAWELFKSTGNCSYMSLFMNLEHDLIQENELSMENDFEMGM